MEPLGIFLLWAGYTLGVFGYSKMRSAYGLSPNLSLSDLVLPSHRATYLAAAATWGNQGGGVPGSAAVGGAPDVTTGIPGDAQSSGVTVVQPTGGKNGLSGVDVNGNHYVRSCPTCKWKLVETATGQPTGQV